MFHDIRVMKLRHCSYRRLVYWEGATCLGFDIISLPTLGRRLYTAFCLLGSGLGFFTFIMANMPHVTLSLAQCWALFISSGAKGVITVFPGKLQIVPCIQSIFTARNRISNKLNQKNSELVTRGHYLHDLRSGVIDPDKSDKPASTFLPRFRRSPHLSGGLKMTFFSFPQASQFYLSRVAERFI